MHTLSSDARNLLELLHGFIAAERHTAQNEVACPLTTLGIADVLYAANDGSLTLRQLVTVLDDIGQSTPTLGDVLAAHFALAASVEALPVAGISPGDVFSVNGSHPAATVQASIDFPQKRVVLTRGSVSLPLEDAQLFYIHVRNMLWITQSACLSGVLNRIAQAVQNPLNETDVQVSTASTRALIQAAAERSDHAAGYGPYVDGEGFGQRFDVSSIATVTRHALFAHLNRLAEQCEPPLRDALGVVSGRAITLFGAPSQDGVTV